MFVTMTSLKCAKRIRSVDFKQGFVICVAFHKESALKFKSFMTTIKSPIIEFQWFFNLWLPTYIQRFFQNNVKCQAEDIYVGKTETHPPLNYDNNLYIFYDF